MESKRKRRSNESIERTFNSCNDLSVSKFDSKSLHNESEIDSAYSSGYCSNFSTPNVSHSSIGQFSDVISTPQRLEAIPENLLFSNKLTPVTEHVNRILNFHITTPTSNDFRKQTSVKRSSVFSLQSTPKKIKYTENKENSLEENLLRTTPNKLAGSAKKNQLFSEKKSVFYDSSNSGLNFDSPINKYEEKLPKLKLNFSPNIKENEINQKLNPNPESIKKLLNCSDEDFNKILNTESNDFLEESFSYYKKIYPITNAYKAIGPICKVSTSAAKKSFRRVLSFSANESPPPALMNKSLEESLTEPEISSPNNSTQSSLSDFGDNQATILAEYKTCFPIISSVFNERNQGRKRTKVPNNSDFDRLSPPKSKIKCYSLEEIRDRCELNSSNCSIDDCLELKPIFQKEITLSTPKVKIRRGSENTQKLELTELPKTPKKLKYSGKNEKSYCWNFRTPPKRNKKKKEIKRQDNISRNYYHGAIKLNILKKLEAYPSILDKIFSHLSDYDLINLKVSSKGYFKMIEDNYNSNIRVNSLLNNYRKLKENYCNQKQFFDSYEKLSDGDHGSSEIGINKKLPFGITSFTLNRKRLSVEDIVFKNILKSPSVSPSKRKFHEHQKIVSTLTKSQRCVKCPCCGKASRIIYNETQSDEEEDNISKNVPQTMPIKSMSTNFKDNNIRLKKTMSVDSGLYLKRKTRHDLSPKSFVPYGECGSFSCKFKFCIDCFSEYHPGTLCITNLETGSPKKDELNLSPVGKKIQMFKNSKFRRKSLKRLCF